METFIHVYRKKAFMEIVSAAAAAAAHKSLVEWLVILFH